MGNADGADHAARQCLCQRPARECRQPQSHLGDVHDDGRRPRVPLRQCRQHLDRLLRRAPQPAGHGRRDRLAQCEPRLGRDGPGLVYRASTRARLGRLLQRPAECLRRRSVLPSACLGPARRHAQPRRVGDPGRRLDDRPRLRGAVHREVLRRTRRNAGSRSTGRRPGMSSGR